MEAFKFKQFSVNQDLAAMKVGTDGVLLGAWIQKRENVKRVLDVGTGTGLIALMLAQKFEKAVIDAIEIEKDAFQQASENASSSRWKNRIQVMHTSMEDFEKNNELKYDLIVCNPPYFTNNWKIEDEKRELARDTKNYFHHQLLKFSKKMLTHDGRLALILPCDVAEFFLKGMEAEGMFLFRRTNVKTKEYLAPKRSLLELVKEYCQPETDSIIIEHAGPNNYTEEYKQLTGEYYINF